MEHFFGQFQAISRRHKRGQFGVLRVCIENVICNGVVVEPYSELPRPPDMIRMGIIQRGAWLAWEASDAEARPHNLRLLPGEQPRLQAIADAVPFAGEGGDAVAMFLKGYRPPADELIYEPSVPSNSVSDMFMRGYQPPKEEDENPHACNTTQAESVTDIIHQSIVKS